MASRKKTKVLSLQTCLSVNRAKGSIQLMNSPFFAFTLRGIVIKAITGVVVTKRKSHTDLITAAVFEDGWAV